MAMKKCRECGHSVSSSAKKCPSCGVKEPYISPFKGILFLVAIGWATWVVFIEDKSSDSSSSSSYHSNDIASSRTPTSAPFVSPDVARLKKAAPVNLAPADTRPFSASQVCKAAIGGMLGREVSIINAAKTNTAGVFAISYRRPSDNQRFTFDCKLSDDHVIWRESGQYSNRWSGTGNVESNVVFTVKGSSLTITELHAAADDVSYKYTLKDFH
ncbi:hypothetical protein EDC48_106125 [Gibbsiella quercinecans]|uniref:zinc ribbon domain-containing protein n=1 Tax=Gibbsiella quercinecans TaxID=929813 RepID=UPI0010EAA3FD|nr:zinc ribbon domain-containing protein [Gibbsiella quercinecans]TCT89324.1 hypothetical protein EDC48_106125 [Gibbsiella quercinecans]